MEDAFREKEETNKELKNVTQQKSELEKQIEAFKSEIALLDTKMQDGILIKNS